MHEAEKLIHGIRSQQKLLQTLLNYLESKEQWSNEDDQYCRNTLRRVARELISISRGHLVTVILETVNAI